MMTLTNSWGNKTIFEAIESELPPQSTVYWLLISICAAIAWVVYITYYNSRVVGIVLTVIVNKFVKFGHVHIGSFSVSVLSGKVMFRDVFFITKNYSVRIQLGLAIFRWWRPLTRKKINEDLSHSETRLSVYLDNCEMHVYNRTAVYSDLEQLFGIDQLLPRPSESAQDHKLVDQRKQWQWRDLIPVVKVEVIAGRLVFGSYLLPQTLSVNFEDAHLVYTTKPPSTPFDQFMHIVKCKSDNLRIMLVPSPKYSGKIDEPPRCMGDGFVVLQSSDVDIYYYQDEPGMVPYEPELVQLANGDVLAVRTWPCWGMDIKYGKNTDISYGPWADRQREFLWKFFYPPDYQPMKATELPQPGQCRMWKSFDFKMSMQHDVTLDILFTKDKETQAIHMHSGQGSYLEFTIPFVVDASGYTTKVNGQLLHLDATSSLKFRSLLQCETLELSVEAKYPANWNDHQTWKCVLTACKASGYLVFQHKEFFQDLIEDWSTKSRPDIYHFVPYTWHLDVVLKEFELMTLTNEWNWIDCFGQTPENAHLAVCGDIFRLSLALPYDDYLPETILLNFLIRGEMAVARLYLPETNTSQQLVLAIANSLKVMDRHGNVSSIGQSEQQWSRVCSKSSGWVDIWSTPKASVNVAYKYHSIPPSGLDMDEFPGTPDGEETILIPVLVAQRPLRPRTQGRDSSGCPGLKEFDPTLMNPDNIDVKIEIGSSVCYAYGSLVCNFFNLKENYFGDDQKFTDLESDIVTSGKKASLSEAQQPVHCPNHASEDDQFDARCYRPLHVSVQLDVSDIQAHLVKNCTEDGAVCPSVFLERLAFEMDKRYEETKLQVLLSPALLVAKDQYQRPESHGHLQDGHLALSGLQVRGHAMFSHKDLPLDSETLEYSWLLEVTIGDITGRLTAPQLQNIIEFLQTFVYLFQDPENSMLRPVKYRLCQHMVLQPDCMYSHHPAASKVMSSELASSPSNTSASRMMCPTSDDLKYRFVRLSIDCIDLYLVESGTALNVQVYPVRLAMCTLHSSATQRGISLLIPHVSAKQFVLSVPVTDLYNDEKTQNICWLEAGGIGLGPIIIDAALALPNPELLRAQREFIALHDRRTQRLSFLWGSSSECGCVGGSVFFGSNRNGSTVFHPSEDDFVNSINSAVLYICNDGVNFGFGESILRPGQPVFKLDFPAALGVQTSVLSGHHRRPVDDDANRTQTHDSASFVVSSWISDHHEDLLSEKNEDSSEVSTPAKLMTVNEQDTSPSSISTPVESKLPMWSESQMTGVPTGSVCSLSDTVPSGLQRRTHGHGRTYSYEPPKTFAAVDKVHSASGTPDTASGILVRGEFERSHGSLKSSSGSHSRRSSLTSPVLRRLSSQLSVQQEDVVSGSLASVVSSEQFYSASEYAGSSLPPGSHADVVSPGSDEVTGSSIYDIAAEFLGTVDTAESSTDVESFVSAPEDTGITVDETLRAPRVSSDEEDDDGATFAADEDVGDESFDTDATQVPQAPCYVDLHGQINQPITKSPLLMSCYANYMTQLACTNWSVRAPQPVDTGAVNSGGSAVTMLTAVGIPHFSYISEGFTPGLMVERPIPKSPLLPRGLSRTVHDPKQKKFFADTQQNNNSQTDAADPLTYEGHISKTTAVINLKGSVDVMVSPLMLEALQRYIEAVTPMLSALHPSAIIDGLHFQCTSAVEQQNKLKAAQASSQPSPVLTTSEKKKSSSKEQRRFGKKHQPRDTGPEKIAQDIEADVEEGKCQMSRLQVVLSLSKINVCVVQASLVEEVISIAALDRARELTCVSVLAASIDHITLQLLGSSVTKCVDPKQAVAAGIKPSSVPVSVVGAALKSHGKPQALTREVSSDTNVEINRDDLVGSLDISCIHFQLRRMKKYSNYSDQVFLTAIPEHRSQVLFTFRGKNDIADKSVSPAKEEAVSSSSMSRHGQKHGSGNVVSAGRVEDTAGFIMFECGLENIQVRVARRKGYEPKPIISADGPSGDGAAPDDVKVDIGYSEPAMQTSVKIENEKASAAAEAKTGGRLSMDAESLRSSSDGNSADDEASSYHSDAPNRVEQAVDDSEPMTPSSQTEDRLTGDAASGVLEFKTVWFNFAAPPPSPRKRKLEYTRNDWNLLSTATPAINAWMNPCHRAVQASDILYGQLSKRVCTVMACIMTEALDYERLHMPYKSKYGKITDLSRTLQEDPSCQLLTVLRRYICSVGIRAVEASLVDNTLPQSLTVKKGLLVLIRQWKNVLYMPMLADPGFKTKKKVAVTFAVPMDESIEQLPTSSPGVTGIVVEETETMLDSFDIVDECTSLLRAEGGSVSQTVGHGKSPGDVGGIYQTPEVETHLSPITADDTHAAIDASNVSLASSSDDDVEWVDAAEDRALTATSQSLSAPSTPHQKTNLTRQVSEVGVAPAQVPAFSSVSTAATGANMYHWMKRQQDYTASRMKPQQLSGSGVLQSQPLSVSQESWTFAGASQMSHDDSVDDSRQRYVTHSAFQLADAQLLFKPLLGALGLESVQMSAIMKELGGALSLRGGLSALRINIVDSDFGSSGRRSDATRGKKPSSFRIEPSVETPAFVCDTFSVQLSTRGLDTSEGAVQDGDDVSRAVRLTEEQRRRQSMRSLQAAMGRISAVSRSGTLATTRVDFVVSCRTVTQHVNMSLLRLAHQFATMIENIAKTRSELRGDAELTSLLKTELAVPAGGWTRFDMQHSLSKPHSHVIPGHIPASLLHHGSRLKADRYDTAAVSSSVGMSVDTDVPEFSGAAGEVSSPAITEERTIVDEIHENTPKCWRTLYHLLDLYSTMPEMKTISRSQLSVIEEEDTGSQPNADKVPHNVYAEGHAEGNDEVFLTVPLIGTRSAPSRKPNAVGTFTQSVVISEKTPLVIFGVAKVKRVRISALLSGLKLEADLENGQASATYRKKVRGIVKRRVKESSVTLSVGQTMIVLLEGTQTVVRINIGKSQGLHSSFTRRSGKHDCGLLSIGLVDIDIPQHPVILHGMVARSSKRLSTTLQEFIRMPTTPRPKPFDVTDDANTMSRSFRHLHPLRLAVPSRFSVMSADAAQTYALPPPSASPTPAIATTPSSPGPPTASAPSKPPVIHFKALFCGLTVGASLLPSLKAQYKIGEVTSCGVTGSKAQFTINLPVHSLSFSSKLVTLSNLPSSASIDMPPVHINAVCLQHDASTTSNIESASQTNDLAGLTVREGSYLKATADVGAFEHILTTDLLNHLVFVQKVFMKEVNEVVQKVSGSDQPVPILFDEALFSHSERTSKPLLYSFLFRLKGIQLTATTPTSNAVRLETGMIELELSNRVQGVAAAGQSASSAQASAQKNTPLKVFVRAVVDLNLALGTLLKNPMFEEAESEFQHLASFQTRITLRNALQHEMIPGVSKDQEALLIALKRPIIFILPAAFDKAVLVWLNYKNAYEYWTEQRLALNREVQTATHQLLQKLPLGGHQSQQPAADAAAAPTATGTLFLQLTVEDLGICLPMNQFSQGIFATTNKIDEPGAALVLTLESTQVSACSCLSLVSKGRFQGFCLRFADDFEVSWDDWKPDPKMDIVMNALVVPHGTYEVCSQTINPRPAATDSSAANAKWILNVQWQMRGIDIHIDTNIGKRLSAMGNTLTMLAGDQFDGYEEGSAAVDDPLILPSFKVEPPSRKQSVTMGGASDILPQFVYDTRLDPKMRARLVETEMNEQAKLVQDLHQLGASRNTIEMEERKLHDLQAVLFRDFRQDIVKRLKRQSVRASTIKDKLGFTSSKPSHSRSLSIGVPSSPAALSSSWSHEPSRGFPGHARRIQSSYTPERRRGHSRTISVDIAELPDVNLQAGFDQTGRPTTLPASDMSYAVPEEDSSNSAGSPTVVVPPGGMASDNVPLMDHSDSTTDSEVDILPSVSPRRVPARTHIAVNQPQESLSEKTPSPSVFSHGGSGTGVGGSTSKAQQEPSVDFELDIKVDIDSGKCVLHPKDPKPEAEDATRRTKGFQSSPDLVERKKSTAGKKVSIESSRLAALPVTTNKTVFFLPGVDIKVHYNSKTSPAEDTESPSQQEVSSASKKPSASFADVLSSPFAMQSGGTAAGKKNTIKKANLYAWLLIPPLPEEMLISPALLDFLEQAIEPIPVVIPLSGTGVSKGSKNATGRGTVDIDTSATSLVSSTNYAYASFPVDVVVYIRIQPSLIRFTCLPVSRVECLLRFPSVDVVFSSTKADLDSSASDTSVMTGKSSGRRSVGTGLPSSRGSTGNTARLRSASGVASEAAVLGGGLSVTGSLSNFSLYIFHPYGGGGQKKTSLAALENTFRKSALRTGSEDKDSSISMDTGRKDSLSLNVEFVKVNISRSRKGFVPTDILSSATSTSFSSSSGAVGGKLTSVDSQAAANVVRFSAVCDIGSASFKYDMRRLLEILALPKAWYRRSLARRMFLGEEPTVPDDDSQSDDDTALNMSSSTSDLSLFSSFDKESADQPTSIGLHTATSNPSGVTADTALPRPVSSGKAVGAADSRAAPAAAASSSTAVGNKQAMRNWETLVLFAVNLSRLDVMVNMSNVMGNTVWSTRDLKSQGRFSIDSSGYTNTKISAGLGGSKLDARGGIIGGSIELQQLDSEVCISEDPGKEPEHMVFIKLHIVESRLDYMGSSILMGRVSDLAVKVNDEWHVDTGAHKQEDRRHSIATSRSVLVFVHGDLTWDRLHLMISRSTTPELIKMIHKLEEFFTQQRTSSKRVLSAFGPMSSASKVKVKQKDEDTWISEIRHHRHWQRVLEHMCGSKLSALACKLPEHGTVIGGTMSLQGHNIALACFHGINFRSKSWALFTMDEPYICFATEAADVVDDGQPCTHVVQNLSFQLGQYHSGVIAEKKPMALVCKLSRGHYMPPPFTSVQDWFHYAFATSEIKDLDSFPVMIRQDADGTASTERRAASRRSTEYVHDTELIFIMPSLQMHLKTEHMQGEREPLDDDPKPVVNCSFVTEFEDHIYVAMDAEAVLFIHDLVTNYVKEKDQGTGRGQKTPAVEQQKLEDPTSVLKQDFRTFNCETWHLEPTVRLLSWAGKRIDPVGVDYILHKLGFQHARLTIPKWMQRGAMDPLDKILSVLVDRLIMSLREQDDEEADT